jgi:hypothetical protein
MPIQPLLDAATLATNLAEIKPALSPQEARVEATRKRRSSGNCSDSSSASASTRSVSI